MQKVLFLGKGLPVDFTSIFKEFKICLFLPSYRGLSPAEAEFSYLSTARTLELYGVELHYARVGLN